MKRRTVLLGAAGAVAAAGGATLLWKPEDRGGPHDAYFSGLNAMLKREGPGHPVMLVDIDRMNRNIDVLAGSVAGRIGPFRQFQRNKGVKSNTGHPPREGVERLPS